MNDKEIRRLLENVEVEPSAHCWEAISSNIAAAGAGSAATAGAAKAAVHTLSTTAKVIIGAVGVAAVATTAVILAVTGVSSPKETATPEKQIVVAETTRSDETVPVVEENVSSVGHAQPAENTATPKAALSSKAAVSENAVAATTAMPAMPEPAPKGAEATAATIPSPSPAPQATTSATPAKSSAAPSAPKPATSEAIRTSPLTDLSDPVLENAETLNSIDFTPPVALVIPNIITPNGDGYNDVFIIKGIDQTERNRLIVRNSTGAIVFQTVNYRNDWGASGLPDGTYFYQFVYTLHGIDETRTGTLTIMR